MNKPSACCAAARQSFVEAKGTQDAQDEAAIIAPAAGEQIVDRQGMIHLPGGTFLMGTNDGEGYPADGEGPVREIELRPFYMDACAVSNAQFQRFAEATGYVTEAERFGWSYVFHLFVSEEAAKQVVGTPRETPWWCAVEGANWKQPRGADSSIDGLGNHPVVHISWNDVQAYCTWAGKRMPTEAEWEYAARGGLVQKRYAWGDLLKPDGQHRCNIWQGKFPSLDHASDGYSGTAPVDAYEPNGFGLYNACGNVWEWCSDWFSKEHHVHSGQRSNPAGPAKGSAKVLRGGSYLCHKSYCNRYRVAARSQNTPDSSSGNIGFRCAADV
ncbi:formylglycine-generating enzyme family protein [Paenibacillus albus]|uniref:Formylglycine-generating enzyme family protein n=1 Tax=Paenibacillus albus TaxID=2495582 RepID=A0A3S9ACB4_9BACL|nr:formylglycine-generating enzyme family protein [Paenibacillus albus]AZN43321.1 formylglycine-generating enzyme family protein [Paenibacillus albus]